MAEVGYIYVVHFAQRYKHALHYVGWTKDLRQRFYRHTADTPVRRGSALMRAVVTAGIGFKVVYLTQGTRDDERAFHERRRVRFCCPVCRGIVTYADAPNLIDNKGAG